MSEGRGGAAIIGAGVLGMVATGARFCDDAARIGRVGADVAPLARVSDDLIIASGDAMRLVDDPVIAGRLTGAGKMLEDGGRARWIFDESDVIELTVDIGIEVLGNLEWDSGMLPLTPPIGQLSGMWIAAGAAERIPTAWMCIEPAAETHRRCAFVYESDGELIPTEGLLIVREGMICRSILLSPPLPGMSAAETLVFLNQQPCEQIVASSGSSMVLSGPAGAYRMVWSGE